MVYAEWLDWRDDRIPHIARHGITVREFEEAFFDVRRKSVRVGPAERNPDETIYRIYGRTLDGRYLFLVVLLYADQPVVLPVTGRDMTNGERRRYRR